MGQEAGAARRRSVSRPLRAMTITASALSFRRLIMSTRQLVSSFLRANQGRKHVKLILVTMACLAALMVAACSAHNLLPFSGSVSRQSEKPSKEIWVTRQGESAISILSFPNGSLLGQVTLPSGTQPHIITFHSSAFAYVSGMGNGTLNIIDANSRSLVKTLSFAPALCHQGKVSPDGTTMLVSVVSNQTLYKVAVDEANRSWTTVGSLSFAPLGKKPVCTVFRADSQRAYVSLMPSGIAIVDVPSMTILGTLPTDGFIACGMIKPSDSADHAVIASSGSGGHIYT